MGFTDRENEWNVKVRRGIVSVGTVLSITIVTLLIFLLYNTKGSAFLRGSSKPVALEGPVFTDGGIRAGVDMDAELIIFEGEGEIQNSYKWIGETERWNARTIVFRDGITLIGDHEFDGAFYPNLTAVVFAGDVEKIGAHAFSGCEKLTEVKCWGSVKEIDKFAFEDCLELEVVEVGPSCEIKDGAFSGTAFESP